MAGYENFQVDRNKNSNFIHPSLQGVNPSKSDEKLTKSEKLTEGIIAWTSYYRARPDVFAEEYLGLTLKPFQKVILYAMIHYNYTMFLASRGLGKTWLTALYCIVRCILYPKTKIVIASGVKSQAMKVVSEKIPEIIGRAKSGTIEREIKIMRANMNTDEKNVEFMNGSWIKIVPASENARSSRANVLILDEFRMVDKHIYDNTLRKFLSVGREPAFLDKEPYKTDREQYVERNQEIFLSSCWYKYDWSYGKFITFSRAMVSGSRYFVCGLPYEIGIKEGLNNKEQLLDEMREEDIDLIGFSMEMECLFFGESEKAYFKTAELEKIKVITKAVYPKTYYTNGLISDKKFKYPAKGLDEIRIVSADIAMIGSSKNDASIYSIIFAKPKYKSFKGRDLFIGYDRKTVYMESYVGEHSKRQAIRLRELYDDFDCDYIVLDRAGSGVGVYDQLSSKLYNEVRDIEYVPFVSMNDERLDSHTLYQESEKKIYTVHGSLEFNNDVAVNLKNCIASKKMLFLKDRNSGEEYLFQFPEFHSMSAENKAELLAPYVQTQSLINEMVLLENKRKDIVSLQEPSNGRKDRYSSVSYGNHFITILERDKIKNARKVFEWQKYVMY